MFEKDHLPRVIFLSRRVVFDLLTGELMAELRRKYSTKFVLLLNDPSLAGLAKKWLGDGDNAIYVSDLNKKMMDELAAPETAEAVWARAKEVEEKYGFNIFYDVFHQDKRIATTALGVAAYSPYNDASGIDYLRHVREAVWWCDTFERLFTDYGVDIVLERPGDLMTAVSVEIALAKGIPVTFSTPARHGGRIIWSDGPYMGCRCLKALFSSLEGHASSKRLDLPGESEIKLGEMTLDAIPHYKSAKMAGSIFDLCEKLAKLAVDRLIWLARDIARGKFGKRLSFWPVVKSQVHRWHASRSLARLCVSDPKHIKSAPYILFLLPLEPEYTTLSLARDFSDTLFVIQRLAFSLPAGVRLVIKEHSINIGNRSIDYYRRILALPNVLLVDPQMPGTALASDALAVATISGTIALEAASLGKRALMFTSHIEYSFLPNITIVESTRELPKTLRTLTAPYGLDEAERYKRAASVYYDCLEQITFDAPSLAIFGGNEAPIEHGEIARAAELLIDYYKFTKRHGCSEECLQQ